MLPIKHHPSNVSDASKKSFSRLSISCIFIKCELPVKYLILLDRFFYFFGINRFTKGPLYNVESFVVLALN